MACLGFLLAIFSSLLLAESVHSSLSNPLNLKQLAEKVKLASNDYVKGSIWPKPQSLKPTGKKLALSPNSFTFEVNGKTSDVLTHAVQRYKSLTFPDANMTKKAPGLDVLQSLEIIVDADYKNLTIESDESCKISLTYCICIYIDLYVFLVVIECIKITFI